MLCISLPTRRSSQGRQSRERKWRHMTSGDRKWRHLTGSHLKVAVEGRKLAYTVRFTSYKAVARGRNQSHDGKWRHMTLCDRKWRHLTGRHVKVAVEGRKLACTVHFISYKAVARRKKSRDRKWLTWPQVTGNDPEVVILAEVTWKWLYKAGNSCILRFHFL